MTMRIHHKKSKLVFTGIGLCLAVTLLCSMPGCEVSSSNERLSIKPQSSELLLGQSVTLTVEGGYDLTWSLENETWGILSSRQGNSVVYTSRYRPEDETAVTQVVRVTSRIWKAGTENSESSESSTNNVTPYIETAEAYILHLRNPM
ncbi:MAG: hypothetical protein GX811_05665 [Lentisphaerae bacterium]|nr:hypothetical protein [Lentisphaerota bacterium]